MVSWTINARDDLENIYNYIAKDSCCKMIKFH